MTKMNTLNYVSICAALERSAVVAAQKGELNAAKELWSRWDMLMRVKIQHALEEIDAIEREIIYSLQHSESVERMGDSCVAQDWHSHFDSLKRNRKHWVGYLGKHAEWLAKELAKTWVSEKALVNIALKSAQVQE